MPDPKTLRVDDRIQFSSLPREWDAPEHFVHEESVEFMKALISRGRPARVFKIDEEGCPWIAARLRREDGALEHHEWVVREATGWKRLEKRTR